MTLLIAEAGLGVGLVLAREADRVPTDVILRPIADLTHGLNLHAAWRRDTRNPVVEQLVAQLLQHS